MSEESNQQADGFGTSSFDANRLQSIIEQAAAPLPSQGPITVFIAQNKLQAFEQYPFDEGMKRAAATLGCHPYLSEDRYRDEVRKARIRYSDLEEALKQDLGESASNLVADGVTRLNLRMAMLKFPAKTGPTAELLWYIAEANALKRIRSDAPATLRSQIIGDTRRWVMRDLRAWSETGRPQGPKWRVPAGLSELLERLGESSIENWDDERWEEFTLRALWRICIDGVKDLPCYTPRHEKAIRHRDLLIEACGEDSDQLVNEPLIRIASAFLDQGLARRALPLRDQGLFRAFCSLYGNGPAGSRWLKGLPAEVAGIIERDVTPLESIHESLTLLGIPESEYEPFIASTMLAVRGWAGMIRQVELRGDFAVKPIPKGSLIEFVAIHLILDRYAVMSVAREALDYQGDLKGLRDFAGSRTSVNWPPSDEQRAFGLFQLAQILGLSPDLLFKFDRDQWTKLLREIESFSSLERRRIFHSAYEQIFKIRTLDAISLHSKNEWHFGNPPRFQAVFCLDEREESLRRHLEEVAPDVETLGAAGFFNVVMYYKGAADAHFTALCPIVVRPQHWIIEEVGVELDKSRKMRATARRAIGTASHKFHVGSRSAALGAVLTGALGVFASFPLVARILFPRLTAQIRLALGKFVRTPPLTHLHLERLTIEAGQQGDSTGFNLDEMTANGERLLRDMGLTSGFSRLVLIIGHGSNSQNNPYNSAYNCGACGGGNGGPNARAMAQILNDLRVRSKLAERGIHIPDETDFVGGWHNTCNDTITYFDQDQLLPTHKDEFDKARANLEEALARNAHERCRRFLSAPLTLSFKEAREHVEERAEDLAQTRPELGHATNAIVIVGRRSWSRGLFLDRRAFLASYDPHQDDADCSILTRILQAAVPVCSGISFEYYFSHVDNKVIGSGTKLPHNLAALVGVMDGAASDLRSGLPWQMVEMHEPIRPLFMAETTPDRMIKIMERNEGIGRMIRNMWIQMALIDPDTRAVMIYEAGAFVPYQPYAAVLPEAPSSVQWYRGWRDNLEFAEIIPTHQATS